MYRYKLLKDGKQIYSSNNYMLCLAEMVDDKRYNVIDSDYEVVDSYKTGEMKPERQALGS